MLLFVFQPRSQLVLQSPSSIGSVRAPTTPRFPITPSTPSQQKFVIVSSNPRPATPTTVFPSQTTTASQQQQTPTVVKLVSNTMGTSSTVTTPQQTQKIVVVSMPGTSATNTTTTDIGMGVKSVFSGTGTLASDPLDHSYT